jgi:glutathione S-transferase
VKPIDNHRLEQSRSQRILWLLEELKVPYELEIFHRDPKTHFAPPELKKVHALGKSPVISVTAPGSSEPVIVAESALVVEYLLDHFANGSTLLPKRWKEGQEGKVGGETEEWLRFRYYMHYAEGRYVSTFLSFINYNYYSQEIYISCLQNASSKLC